MSDLNCSKHIEKSIADISHDLKVAEKKLSQIEALVNWWERDTESPQAATLTMNGIREVIIITGNLEECEEGLPVVDGDGLVCEWDGERIPQERSGE